MPSVPNPRFETFVRELTLGHGQKVFTGARPTSRAKLAKAHYAFRNAPADLPPPPASCINTRGPAAAFGMGGNDQFGDCVSAEEAHAKQVVACATGAPLLQIADSNVIAWARDNGDLNGADLPDVVDQMMAGGMLGIDGKVHNDGSMGPGSIDYTNEQEVRQAIYLFKTVKFGVSSGDLERAVGGGNGWLMARARGGSQDHCVGVYDYGTAADLCQAWGCNLPAGADASTTYYSLCTWGTIGLVTWEALQAIAGEAWVRINDPDRADAAAWDLVAAADYAATSNEPVPTPSPAPTPGPSPDPGPRPRPCRRVRELIQAAGNHPQAGSLATIIQALEAFIAAHPQVSTLLEDLLLSLLNNLVPPTPAPVPAPGSYEARRFSSHG